MAWKLRTRPESDYLVTELILAESLKQHLMPFIAPTSLPTEVCSRNLKLFSKLIVAQLEYNAFISTTIASFCFNDDFCYRVEGGSIVLFSDRNSDESSWDRNGLKLEALHRYWFNRALIEGHLSGALYQPFGQPENDHKNRFAYIKTRRVFLQLEEVYGLNGRLEFSEDASVDLVKAIHSLELMTAFFNDAFIEPFKTSYKDSGHWGIALQQLVMDGLRDGFQNRFPLTWAEHEEKAQSIKSWTVSEQHPQGDIEEARAILTFWRNDLKELAENLKRNPNIPAPELHEKPILKLGQYGFQLPWLTAAQNNSTATINNLRRLGSRHKARGEETRRIERRLGEQLKAKDFFVVHGYQPEVNVSNDPGEVDLICFLEGHLFILEVKSTYLRKTQQEAWIHRSNTLRKAGQQLKRKQEAVTSALKTDNALQDKLHINNHTEIIGVHPWIVDTSLEYDQENIDGFLKVSLEALLIVLRNDQYLLRHSLMKSMISAESSEPSALSELFDQYETGNNRKDDLFPQGFNARRFAEIVESGELWCVLDE
jgi:Nuclease-related domain